MFLALVLLAQLQLLPHHHPDKLPVDEKTWNACCHGEHCRKANLIAQNFGGRYWKISLEGCAPFIVESLPEPKTWGPWVENSRNGESYICLREEKCPTAETITNFICAFYLYGGFN